MGFFDRLRRRRRTTNPLLTIMPVYRTTPVHVARKIAAIALASLADLDDEEQSQINTQRRAMIDAGRTYLRLARLDTPPMRRLVEMTVTSFLHHTDGSMDITEAATDLMVHALTQTIDELYAGSVPSHYWEKGEIVVILRKDAADRVILTGRTCGLCEVSPTGVRLEPGQPAQSVDLHDAACVNDECAAVVSYKKTSV